MKLLWNRFLFHHNEKLCSFYHDKDSDIKENLLAVIKNRLEAGGFDRFRDQETSVSLWRAFRKSILQVEKERELTKLFVKCYNCESLCCKTAADELDRDFKIPGEVYFSFVFAENDESESFCCYHINGYMNLRYPINLMDMS